MKVRITLHVDELEPGDRVLGLTVTAVTVGRGLFSSIRFENEVSLSMESRAEITVERDVETVEEGAV